MKHTKFTPQQDFIENIPKKRSSAIAILFDENDHVLLLKPNYRDDGWSFPGGIVERFESPKNCVLREMKEEIGISDISLRLICIEYMIFERPWGKDEKYNFIFSGNIKDEERECIVLQDSEISECAFLEREKVLDLLIDPLKNVYKALLKNNFEDFSYIETFA